jgi:hypothetical protein
MVERLFRSRVLRVVVATATLAVGIHMPCRSVVFPEPSQFMDAMSFHQMGGRAGRRGYDPVGNVVFANFDFPRIKQLVSHNTVPLSSLQRIDTTDILQLLHLSRWDISRAGAAIRNTLHNFIGGPESIKQVENSYHLALRIFFKLGLTNTPGLSKEISCTAQAAGALKLSQYAPANFHLMKILLCEALDPTQPPMTEEELLLLLAFVFNIRESRPLNSNELKQALPSLPPKIISLVDHINSEILWEACRIIDEVDGTAVDTSDVNPLLRQRFTSINKIVLNLSRRFSPSAVGCGTKGDKPDHAIRLSGPLDATRSIFESNSSYLESSCLHTFGFGLDSLPLLILAPHMDAYVAYTFFASPLPEYSDEMTHEESCKRLLETIHENASLFGSEVARTLTDFFKFVEKLRMALVSLETSYPSFMDKISLFNQRMQTLSRHMQTRASFLGCKSVTTLGELRKRSTTSSPAKSPAFKPSASKAPWYLREQASPLSSSPSKPHVELREPSSPFSERAKLNLNVAPLAQSYFAPPIARSIAVPPPMPQQTAPKKTKGKKKKAKASQVPASPNVTASQNSFQPANPKPTPAPSQANLHVAAKKAPTAAPKKATPPAPPKKVPPKPPKKAAPAPAKKAPPPNPPKKAAPAPALPSGPKTQPKKKVPPPAKKAAPKQKG